VTFDLGLARRCADVALACYSTPPTIETDDVHALLVDAFDLAPGLVIVGLEGTNPRRLVDLWRDAAAIDIRRDPLLGDVPESFAGDAEQLFWRILPKLEPGRPFAITGHSKGASEAQLLATMFALVGRAPVFLAAFEPAAVGDLRGLIKDLPWLATRHGRDPITFLPPGRPHAQPLLQLPWDGPVPADPLDYHGMQGVRDQLYCWRPPA
jgi:hypothetical protein